MFGSPPDDGTRSRRSSGSPYVDPPRQSGPPPTGRGPMPAAPPPRDAPRGGPPREQSRERDQPRDQSRDQPREPQPARSRRAVRTGHKLTSGGETTGPIPEAGREAAEVPFVPVRRLLSLTISGFAVLLAVGLVMGAQTAGVGGGRLPYAVVIFGAQLLYVLATTMAIRPLGARVVGSVGILAAIAADLAAIYPDVATIGPLGFIAAGGLVVGVLSQVIRPEGRVRATESLGTTLVIVLGVISFATLIVLTRIPGGTQAIVVCLISAGVALSVARLTDVIAPWPRLADQVPRGSLGIVGGAMLGTAVAAIIGKYLVPFTPANAAIIGMAAAVAAVLADLTIGFAEAGREAAGDPPTMWLARHMQGPLAGFALAAPVAYLISVYYLAQP